MQNNYSLALIFSLFNSFNLNAQESVKSFKEEFNWDKANLTKTIILEVKKGSDIIEIEFEGNITEGALELTAYDTEGNKVAGFSLVCSGKENSSVHVESIGGKGKNSSSNSNSNSNNNHTSESNDSVSTSSDSNNSSVKVKSKSKNKNKKSRGYYVNSTSSDAKGAKGVMHKKLSNPMPGNWKFVLEVQEVTGKLFADIEQD